MGPSVNTRPYRAASPRSHIYLLHNADNTPSRRNTTPKHQTFVGNCSVTKTEGRVSFLRRHQAPLFPHFFKYFFCPGGISQTSPQKTNKRFQRCSLFGSMMIAYGFRLMVLELSPDPSTCSFENTKLEFPLTLKALHLCGISLVGRRAGVVGEHTPLFPRGL